jgi:D-alanine-D-alanine ligase
MGGTSAEREVSLRSGAAVVEALIAAGYDAVPIELGSERESLDQVLGAGVDAVFLALHGRYGEDGCVQGWLELHGIPYTGSGVLASALAMDKLKATELFRLHNVPTPPYYVLSGGHSLADLEDVHGSFGFPVMVKPRREGSSVGIARAGSVRSTSPARTTTRCWSSASSPGARSRWASSTAACSARSRSRRRAASTTTPPSTPRA